MRVAVCGAAGRMGIEVCRAVEAEPDMALVCAIDPAADGVDLRDLAQGIASELKVSGDLSGLECSGVDALVDFTNANAARQNIPQALKQGIHAIVGTTGLLHEDLAAFAALAEEHGVACLVAPNFAIGAILMMHFAVVASRFMPECEIIEMHHPGKLDAPSGTAALTAERIAESKGLIRSSDEHDGVGAPPSRGDDRRGVRVHSVRLPGLVAHQEVIFGGVGQILTIRHDSLDRSSFMPGVIFALREAHKHPGLTVGLEKWMGL